MKRLRLSLLLWILLNLAISITVSAQEGCPASALITNGAAQVVPGVALLLRETPGFTGIPLLTLAENTPLALLEGPVCQEGALWWRVQESAGTQGWAAEYDGSTTLITLTAAPAQPPTSEPAAASLDASGAPVAPFPTALVPVETDFLPEVMVNVAPPGLVGVFGQGTGAYLDAASLRVVWTFSALPFGEGTVSVSGRLAGTRYILSGHSTWVVATDSLKLVAEIPGMRWSPVSVSPDGRWLAVTHGGSTLGLFDLTAQDIPGSRRGIASAEPVSLAFSPDSSRLAVGERSGAVFVVDTATAQTGPVMPLDMGVDLSVRFLRWADNTRLAAIGRDVLYLIDSPGLTPDVEQATRITADGWTTRVVLRDGWLYLDKYTPTVGNALVRTNAFTGETLVQDDLGAPLLNDDSTRGLVDNESGVIFFDALNNTPLAAFPGRPYRTAGLMDSAGMRWAVFISEPENPRILFYQHPNYAAPAAEIPFPPGNAPRQLQMAFVNDRFFLLADGQLWAGA